MNKVIDTIDMTPSWSGLLPVMLAAHANMERKMQARGCDGREQGWCSVHDMGFERESDTACEFFHSLTTVEQSARLRSLQADFRSNEESFRRMAKGADIAVAVQKLVKEWREDGIPNQSLMLNQLLDTIGWAD